MPKNMTRQEIFKDARNAFFSLCIGCVVIAATIAMADLAFEDLGKVQKVNALDAVLTEATVVSKESSKSFLSRSSSYQMEYAFHDAAGTVHKNRRSYAYSRWAEWQIGDKVPIRYSPVDFVSYPVDHVPEPWWAIGVAALFLLPLGLFFVGGALVQFAKIFATLKAKITS